MKAKQKDHAAKLLTEKVGIEPLQEKVNAAFYALRELLQHNLALVLAPGDDMIIYEAYKVLKKGTEQSDNQAK